MNIDDIEIPDQELTVESIFVKQKELMKVYGEIEGRHYPINLDTREGQLLVKDFLWRITEEVGEALDSGLGVHHVKEELADGLHFLVELCLFTDRSEVMQDLFVTIEETYNSSKDYVGMMQLWISLANVGRVCKNKPWKQTQIPIDQKAFTNALGALVIDYLRYGLGWVFTDMKEMYFYYHKKAKVNEFRQRSHY